MKSLLPAADVPQPPRRATVILILAAVLFLSSFLLPDGERHRIVNRGLQPPREIIVETADGDPVSVRINLRDDQERFPVFDTPFLTRNIVSIRSDDDVRVDPAEFASLGVPDAQRLPESFLNGKGMREHVLATHLCGYAIAGFTMRVAAPLLSGLGLLLIMMDRRRAAIATQRRHRAKCFHCGYPVMTRRCPECARIVDPYPDL